MFIFSVIFKREKKNLNEAKKTKKEKELLMIVSLSIWDM